MNDSDLIRRDNRRHPDHVTFDTDKGIVGNPETRANDDNYAYDRSLCSTNVSVTYYRVFYFMILFSAYRPSWNCAKTSLDLKQFLLGTTLLRSISS